MTGAVADRFSLKGRGYLKKDYAADITVFNAATVANNGDEPVRPSGIEYLYINGKKIVNGGLADESAMDGSGTILQRDSSPA
jgi:N-acyl-D-amino-acid deacylase